MYTLYFILSKTSEMFLYSSVNFVLWALSSSTYPFPLFNRIQFRLHYELSINKPQSYGSYYFKTNLIKVLMLNGYVAFFGKITKQFLVSFSIKANNNTWRKQYFSFSLDATKSAACLERFKYLSRSSNSFCVKHFRPPDIHSKLESICDLLGSSLSCSMCPAIFKGTDNLCECRTER